MFALKDRGGVNLFIFVIDNKMLALVYLYVQWLVRKQPPSIYYFISVLYVIIFGTPNLFVSD